MTNTVLILSLFTISFASQDSLSQIELLPGLTAYIDWNQDTGSLELMDETGNIIIVNYNITHSYDNSYIYFIKETSRTKSAVNSNGGSYWKNEVVRSYPVDTNAPPSISYFEYGPYGYAYGILHWYAAGSNRYNPDYIDVWYEGTLYYGNVTPFSIGN